MLPITCSVSVETQVAAALLVGDVRLCLTNRLLPAVEIGHFVHCTARGGVERVAGVVRNRQ